MNKNIHIANWVANMAKLTQPDQIVWLDGSEAEHQNLIKTALSSNEILELNQEKLPGCYYHRSAFNDVARVEHCTFICTPTKAEAGPTNNWMDPKEAYQKLSGLFSGSMRGKTMYVVPYLMCTAGSPFNKVGIELTDSIYVALNIRIMTRMGQVALNQLGNSTDFVKGLHAKSDLSEEHRFICHFPQDNTIWSVGSGYGGNVILSKKCFALRIATHLARQEGWLAEHMLILGLENPQGEISYITAAFPSACGKTNLAMLVAPLSQAGYKVWTVGDDIAWMRVGSDGRLWAVNPEAGFFGVAPGTSMQSNPNAMLTIAKNTIFTNVAVTPDKMVWWEGMGVPPPATCTDWRGNPWTQASKEKAAHPNSRFTTPAKQCPSIAKEWENPQGVPISAIVFGGRRAKVAPLVYESFSWQHGVYIGATMASETTAAATGKIGVVRRDPMAMLPFCGYNMQDYFAHWLTMGTKIKQPPKIFCVNWFRTDEQNRFMWPGYGENIRILKWIIARCQNKVGAITSPIGYLPEIADIDATGLAEQGVSKTTLKELLAIDNAAWTEEIREQELFLQKFDHLPDGIIAELTALKKRFGVDV